MTITKTVKAEATLLEAFKIEVKARHHAIIIDQGESSGGKDQGMNPLEVQLGAVAACICTIGRIVAKQQRIELRGMICTVEAGLNTQVLMGKHHDERAGFQGMTLHVSIDADMTQAEKEAFVHEVDSRCPVSESLANPTPLTFIVD
jgi:uncharacterized OsmC-like protein